MTGQASDRPGGVGADELTELYRRMVRIRHFEQGASRLYAAKEIPGFLHLSIGQEATAVGGCWHLRRDDDITSTHRGHGHCLAKGLTPAPMFAELMGRAGGTCHGRGGSMHIADPALGVLGANGIVGAGLPIAVGAATAAQLRGDGGVAVSFFGDGAVAQGMFHEAVNLAAVWDLPVIFFCENNHYSEFSREEDQHRAGLAARAAGYGVRYEAVDGNDVVAVAELMGRLVTGLREGAGPVLVEADTYRWHGHYEGDPLRYRSDQELERWKLRDPLTIARARMAGLGLPAELAEQIDHEVAAEIEGAVDAARRSPFPEPESLFDYVWVEEDDDRAVAARRRPDFPPRAAVPAADAYWLSHASAGHVARIRASAGGRVSGLLARPGRLVPGVGQLGPVPVEHLVRLGLSLVGAPQPALDRVGALGERPADPRHQHLGQQREHDQERDRADDQLGPVRHQRVRGGWCGGQDLGRHLY